MPTSSAHGWQITVSAIINIAPTKARSTAQRRNGGARTTPRSGRTGPAITMEGGGKSGRRRRAARIGMEPRRRREDSDTDPAKGMTMFVVFLPTSYAGGKELRTKAARRNVPLSTRARRRDTWTRLGKWMMASRRSMEEARTHHHFTPRPSWPPQPGGGDTAKIVIKGTLPSTAMGACGSIQDTPRQCHRLCS